MLSVPIATAYETHSAGLRQRGVRLVGEGRANESAAPGVARVWETDLAQLVEDHTLLDEVFGPSTLVVRWATLDALVSFLSSLEGQLTATVHATADEIAAATPLWQALSENAGRVLFGGFPTGVEVGPAMVHGGPFPATTHAATSSVGTRAICRFARLVAFQNTPQELLPLALRDGNPQQIWRMIDGVMTH
jgi:NADP-dependent aldehyde dehydrogenase